MRERGAEGKEADVEECVDGWSASGGERGYSFHPINGCNGWVAWLVAAEVKRVTSTVMEGTKSPC